ncbi:MAG: helix-turn-helix domain-containing protein [Blastocatellia bacterium]|nr:helix-turn-helix domain-containing protein [Blastocatellia bacterium]
MSTTLANSPALTQEMPRLTEKACWRGVELLVSSEDISAGTEWAIHEDRHAVIVHLGGAIHQLESEFEGCGAVLDPPMAGEVWLIPAGTRYASRARGTLVRYAELYLDREYLPKYLPDAFGQRSGDESLTPRAGYFDDFLYHAVRRLESLLPQTDDLSQMMSQSLSQSLCLHIFGAHNERAAQLSNQRSSGLTGQEAKLLREYIAAHLGERLTLDALARLVQMSTHNLLRSFRKSFGATPVQYIIAQRLRRARWLLANTNKDITTISLETGFASHSHLTTAFKMHMGLTPSAFRQSRFTSHR